MTNIIEVALPSNFVNVLNFIIFDVFLISAVFYLTSDLAGRLNYFSLSDGEAKHLTVLCPPLLGGGICSTSRRRTYVFLFIRVLAFALIFAANLTIEGKTVDNVVLEEAAIRLPGPIPNISPEAYKTMVLKRLSCQVTHQDFVHFGEIRENDTCVFDRQLLTKPISVAIRFEAAIDFDVGTCMNETRPHLQEDFRGINVYIFRCTNARIHCIASSPKKIPLGCEGVIQKGKLTYLCFQFANRVESKWTGSCREIRNFDFENEFWFYGREIDPDGLYNYIGAASIMQTGRRMVKVIKGRKEITQIHTGWFGLCAAKVALVIALVCAVMYAILHSAESVVNDERSLARLLTSSVARPLRTQEDESALYLHATKIGRRTIFWASGHPLRRKRWFHHENYNREIHEAEEAAL